MLNNLGLNGKNPLIYHIYTKDSPSVTDEDIAIVGKAIVGESKVSDEHVAFEAGMKQVRSMYFNGKLVYNYRPCEKIELNAGELVLTNTVDNSFKLSVKITPSDCTEEVTFTSSNTDVATVNRDGSIHPVNLGTCDIIVTCDKKSVACKVHVKEQTLYLYNRGVVNNNSEFGQIVHPSDTSKFSYASDNIFLTLAGSSSNYGTLWFSWANRVDFGEYDVMHMDITNAADHSTIIGLTRNNKTGQQGYQNGNPTAVDGTTFVDDRTVIALKQGVNKHSLDVDLVNGVGYLGLYFKRNTDTGDTLEEFININTIYLIRKSVYILGTGVDTSEEVNVPCTGLSFTQDEIELDYTSNFMYNLNTILNITPQNCDETVQWTVLDDGDNVMSVNGDGYLSITGLGSAHVQAICGKYFDSIRVNTGKLCESINLNTTSASVIKSHTFELSATISPSNTTDTLTWESSDNNIATVNNGVVTGVSTGKCTITARCGNKSASCNINVISNETCIGESLSMSSATIDLSVNPTIDVKGPAGQMSGHVWSSSNTSIATVNNGVVTGKSVGNCVVSVTCANLTANCNITVKASCTELLLGTSVGTLDVSGTKTTTLQVSKTPSNTTDSITWESSNTNVATVSNGTVTAIAPGTVTITARCGSKSASHTLTVIASCTSVSLSKSTYTLDLSGTNSVTFTPTIKPSNTTDSITWKSNNTSVATVSATSGGTKGTIFAKSAGTADITVKCGSKSASITVTVEKSCTGLSLSKTSLRFTSIGATDTIVVTPTPSNTTDVVSWKSSNNDVATVTQFGLVTSRGTGTCTLTATCGSKSATCSVTVNTVSITAKEEYISVNTNTGDCRLYMKEYFTFTNVNSDNVTWTIEKTSGNIGTLSSTGILDIAFQTVATAKVTASYNGVSASTIVQAVRSAIVCTGLTLNKSSLTFAGTGGTQTLVATPTPANTTDSITWKSNKTGIATVSNGIVTAKAVGTCTITATCGDKTATCNVTVNKVEATGFSLSKSKTNLAIGETDTFTVSLAPGNTTRKASEITVSTSREGVISYTTRTSNETTLIFDIQKLTDESCAINLYLSTDNGTITTRFEVYSKVQ